MSILSDIKNIFKNVSESVKSIFQPKNIFKNVSESVKSIFQPKKEKVEIYKPEKEYKKSSFSDIKESVIDHIPIPDFSDFWKDVDIINDYEGIPEEKYTVINDDFDYPEKVLNKNQTIIKQDGYEDFLKTVQKYKLR